MPSSDITSTNHTGFALKIKKLQITILHVLALVVLLGLLLVSRALRFTLIGGLSTDFYCRKCNRQYTETISRYRLLQKVLLGKSSLCSLSRNVRFARWSDRQSGRGKRVSVQTLHSLARHPIIPRHGIQGPRWLCPPLRWMLMDTKKKHIRDRQNMHVSKVGGLLRCARVHFTHVAPRNHLRQTTFPIRHCLWHSNPHLVHPVMLTC